MNDERLARRAAAGDKLAFEAIFRRYHQDLYRFCLATLGNPQDAQDALQSTMVKVMRALPGERRQIKLKPWLYRIARNEALEVLRRRRPSVELEPEGMAAGAEIAETAAARERLRNLLADLEQLPERQRAALVMRELAGLEFEEIGAAFGTTPAVARQTLYEARQGLSQMEAGREMSCATVRRTLSDADGRVTRRRDIRAHLRRCGDCRAFHEGIARRREDLAAIAPLPLAASAGILQGLLGGTASAGGGAAAAGAAGSGAASGGGLAGAVATGAGKLAATSVIVKSAATVAVVAVGISAADRGGLIDLRAFGGGDTPAPGATPGSLPAGSVTDSRAGTAEDEPGDRAEAGAEPSSRSGGSGDSKGGAATADTDGPRSAAGPRSDAEGAPASAGAGATPAAASPGEVAPSGQAEQVEPGVEGGPPGLAENGEDGVPGQAENGGPGGPAGDLPPASERGQATATERKPPVAQEVPRPRREASDKAPPIAAPASGEDPRPPAGKPTTVPSPSMPPHAAPPPAAGPQGKGASGADGRGASGPNDDGAGRSEAAEP